MIFQLAELTGLKIRKIHHANSASASSAGGPMRDCFAWRWSRAARSRSSIATCCPGWRSAKRQCARLSGSRFSLCCASDDRSCAGCSTPSCPLRIRSASARPTSWNWPSPPGWSAVFLLHPYAEPWLRRLASRPLMCLLLLAMAPVALRLALLPLHPVPRPEAADEFRMLAAAGNLRHSAGRVPLTRWRPSLSRHPIPRRPLPSRSPLRQMVGDPWVGVVLSMAALLAACYWMLRGWTSPGWALPAEYSRSAPLDP